MPRILDRIARRELVVFLAGCVFYAVLQLTLAHAPARVLHPGSHIPAQPSIVKLEPDTGKPGDIVTAYGTRLDSSAVEYIYLTDGVITALVNTVEQNAASIRFRIPSMLAAGHYTVVIRPAGKYAQLIPQAVTLTVV